MPFGFTVFQIQRVAQRLERDVVRTLQVSHGGLQLIGAGLDQGFQVRLIRSVLHLQASVLQGAADSVQELLALERLQKVVVCPVSNGGQRHRNIMHGGNHHHRHVGILLLGALQQANAIKVRHHQVRKHQFELFARIENRESLHTGGRLFAGITSSTEHGRNDFPNRFFVVNYKNAIWHGIHESLSAIVTHLGDAESNH